MDQRVSAHWPDECDHVDVLAHTRKQCFREHYVRTNLLYNEIFGRVLGLFEVPAVRLADGAAHLDNNAMPGCIERVDLCRSTNVQRPRDTFDPRACKRSTAPLQNIPTCRDQF